MKARVIVIASGIMFIFVSIYSLSNTNNFNTRHYELKYIFQKPLSDPHTPDALSLFDNKSQQFIVHGPSPFSPNIGQWYHVPPILYVDKFENTYILIPGRIEVFDTLGNSILTFHIPDDSLILDYYSWSEEGLFLFFKKNNFDLDYQVFAMNVSRGDTKKLSQTEKLLLNSDILPPSSKKEMAQARAYVRSISNADGEFYGIGWGNGNYNLLQNDNERYIDPKEILVLKFDKSYNDFYSSPLSINIVSTNPGTYEKYSYDKINIEEIFHETVVCIGRRNTYVDQNGNVFVIGLKSNDIKRITKKEAGRSNAIEVSNPILFLAKLKNK